MTKTRKTLTLIDVSDREALERTRGVLEILNALAEEKGYRGGSLVWADPEAENAHYREPRYFAYTTDQGMGIHVCKDIGRLPDQHLFGVLAHEIGHLIAGHLHDDWSEEAADGIVEDLLGLRILHETSSFIQAIPQEQLDELI